MRRFATRKFLVLAALVLVAVPAGGAAAGVLPLGKSATPSGYSKFLVYMANGTYNPNDPNYTTPSGEFFQTQIMHRTQAQIDEQRQNALAFFKQRFGIDPANGDVSVGPFMFDPRNDYRAYVIGGEIVPAGGFAVRDGGFSAMVTKDTTLHGTYGGAGGKHVPAGTMVVFGDYNIQRTAGNSAETTKPLILHYQSELPISAPNADGVQTFRCELIDPATGQHGVAQGVIAPTRDAGNGNVQVSVRNVLTFPGF